jgi:hypothetical protein
MKVTAHLMICKCFSPKLIFYFIQMGFWFHEADVCVVDRLIGSLPAGGTVDDAGGVSQSTALRLAGWACSVITAGSNASLSVVGSTYPWSQSTACAASAEHGALRARRCGVLQ